jgi:hypothetical protein
MSRTNLSPSVLCRNRQIETRLSWGPNQETVTVILRHKSPNRSRQFWGPNRETVTAGFEVKPPETVTAGFEAKPLETVASGFEAKPLETVASGFEAKLAEIVATDFEAKPLETITTDFEAKAVKTVLVVLRPNHSQIVAIDFEAQTDEKSSEWFWGQTTHKSSDIGFEAQWRNTRSSSPHTQWDRTWRHPTSRSPGHRVSDLCDHLRSSAPGRLLLPRSSSLHVMPHLPTAHHETSKHDSPDETKIKVKPMNHPGFEFKPHQVNDSPQSNQGTDHLVSQSPPSRVNWQQKHSLKFESKTPWSTAERPKK